jgi:hypothetical protein
MPKINMNHVDILRAHAVAAALKRARPVDVRTNHVAREAWHECVKHLAGVVCTADGCSISNFEYLCGVPVL